MRKFYQKALTAFIAIVMLFNITLPGALAVMAETDDSVAYVWLGENRDKGRYFDDIYTAWSAACNNGNIMMLKNWKLSRMLTVEDGCEVRVYMNGLTIDRGRTSAAGSGEVFLLEENSVLRLYGTDNESPVTKQTDAKVTGGYNSDGGGAIHIKEKASAYLYGVSVTGNATSDREGGGGVRLQGDSSYLYMDSFSCVSNNVATGGDGGGVSIHGNGAKVEGGAVKNNKAAESGGGISTHNKNCSISGVEISNNTAGDGKKGGGIYMAQGAGASVLGCVIEENSLTNGNGGGIYVDGNGGSLSFSSIEKNTAVLGGGVYIDVGDTLALSGDLTVKDNNAKTEEAANMFLSTTSRKAAYISGSPTSGELHIGWDKNVRSDDIVKLTATAGKSDCRYFVCDVPGYYIYWSWQTSDGKNDRLIRGATTNYRKEITHNDTEVSLNNRYTVYDNAYLNGFELQEGIFTYKSTKNGELNAVYYYSDAYFIDKPEFYNKQLATMSFAMLLSASNAASDFDKTLYKDGYVNSFRNAKQLFSDIGFENENIHISESFMQKPTGDSIAVIMGAKELSYENASDNYILVPVIVRGAHYESEWVSNLTVGASGEAQGFSDSADKIMAELESFIDSELTLEIKKALSEGRVKFWLSGFSRGGAVANLVAKRLTDTYGENNSVYAYCFENPKGGVDSAVNKQDYTYDGQYLNIHNIINTGDIVPLLCPEEMGFKRYGVDHFVPGDNAGAVSQSVITTNSGEKVTTYSDNRADIVGDKDYIERRETMLKQLALINDSIIFDDYFALATMNYVGNFFTDNGMVGPLENATETTAQQWLETFIKDFLSWAANGTYSWSTVDGDTYGGDYRRFFMENSVFCGTEYMTLQQALQIFAQLIFASENKAAIIDAMMYRLNEFASDGSMLLDFYLGVITMWDEQAQYRQRWYIDDVWNALTCSLSYPGGKKVPAITDFVSYDEREELKDAAYALLSALFLFICRDYDKQPELAGVDTTQVHLGTLLYNISGIMQCHYPEVCFAWLRADDYHYTNNSVGAYEDKSVKLTAEKNAVPEKVKADISAQGSTCVITLTAPFGLIGGVDNNSDENGSAIYYQIYKNKEPLSSLQLYQDSIALEFEEGAEYSLSAYAVRFQQKSNELTLNDSQLRSGDGMIGTMLGDGSMTAIICQALLFLAIAVILVVLTKKKKAKMK